MTTQIDHAEARRHLQFIKAGAVTWMSDLDPLEIVQGLIDAYDSDVEGLYSDEAVDEAVAEKVDEKEKELKDEHDKEIDRLKDEHDKAISDLKIEHEAEIAKLTAEHEEDIAELKRKPKAARSPAPDRDCFAGPPTSGLEAVTWAATFIEHIGKMDRDWLDRHPPLESAACAFKLILQAAPAPASAMIVYQTSPVQMDRVDPIGAPETRPPLDPPSSLPTLPPPETATDAPATPHRRSRATRAARVKPTPPRERPAPVPSSVGTLPIVAVVLAEAGIGAALAVSDIVARAGERLPTKSKTPATVVSRDLALDVKCYGSASRFRRVAAGIFRLARDEEIT